ncbi:unnamed protein product [Rotaria sp. Silwood2]|nr:unnamed protein product [Rotaria sp. Silwood2]
MSFISFDSSDDISLISSGDLDVISSSSSIRVRNASNSSSSDNYAPEQLKQFLLKKNQKYRLVGNDSTKSLAAWWRAFGFINVQNENNKLEQIAGYISCLKCYHTFRYGFKSGTKHFVDHADRCFPLIFSDSIAANTDDSNLVQRKLEQTGFQRKAKLTIKEKNEFKDLYAKWICCDLRPFTIVEDFGFEHLANMFIKIGAQYGLVDAKDLIPSCRTIGRSVKDLADKYRLELKEELTEPLHAKAVTIAPDFWQNKYNQQAYLGLNITYVHINHQYKSVDLFCRPFNGTKSYDLILKQNTKKKKETNHSTNDVSSGTKQTLTTASLVVEKDDLSSSSESDSSESEEEQDKQQPNKSDEDSSLVVPRRRKNSATTNVQKMSVDNIPPESKQVLFILKQAKKLVNFLSYISLFFQTGLNSEIKANGGATLHQATVVRWLSLSNLLESVIKSFKITRKLLNGKKKQALITDLNLQCLKQLCTLLKPFKHVMTSVQNGNAPSLYLVPMFYITLKEILQSFEAVKKFNYENIDNKEEDDHSLDASNDEDLEHELPGIKWFRERLLSLLNEMIVLDIRQVAATLLHPRYRSLKKIPDHVKDQCYKYVRRQVRQLRDKVEVEEENRQQSSEPPAKRLKKERNMFSRFESGDLSEEAGEHNESSNESAEFECNIKKGDELDRYLLFELDKTKKQIEPLQFWKNHSNRFPILSKYARSIFSIPATTTNVEREFSSAGFILNERRANLQPDKLDDILLVRSVEKQLYKN